MQDNIKNEENLNAEILKEKNTYVAAGLFSKLPPSNQNEIIELMKSFVSKNN